MKKLLLLFVMMLPLLVNADPVEIDGIYYNLISKAQMAEVTRNPNNYSGEVVIPETITFDGKEYSVTSIGDRAFEYCSGLTSVTIPNSVTSIGISAFEDCRRLTSITIPNSVTSIGEYAFWECDGLISVTVEAKTPITISYDVFSNRTNATLYVPAGSRAAYKAADYWREFKYIKSEHIGTEVIDGIYYNLNSDRTAEVTKTPDDSPKYSGTIVIPASVTYNTTTYNVTTIGEYAFQLCSGLTSVTIPNSVTSIGNKAFYICSSLTSVTIPNSVNYIGEYAFGDCTSLTSVTIPNSVNYIGDRAFNYCKCLTSVTIPNSVTSIGTAPFSGCSNLTSLNVEAGNTKYDSRDNCNAIIEKETTRLISGTKNTIIPNSVTSIGSSAFEFSGLTSVIIPNSVTSIGYGAFSSCNGLTSVTIPNSVTSIGDRAFEFSGLTSVIIPNSVTSIGDYPFYICSGLTSIVVESDNKVYDSRNDCNAIIKTVSNTLIAGCKNTVIPNSITSIGDYAFYRCSGLTSVTIPNSMTSIGNYAFNGCSGLTSVTVEAKTPITISGNVFSNRANSTLYVPAGCKAAYQAANYWNEFKEIKELIYPSDMFVFTANPDGTTCSVTGHTDYCIEDVTIPESWEGLTVTTIGNNALQDCIDMTSVIIPNSVTSIGEGAFTNCSGLTSVIIPNSVTSIGKHAFGGSNNLIYVTIEAKTPITISDDVFTNRANATLYVPAGSMTAYLAAGYWNEFKEMIESEPATWTDNNGMKWTFTVSKTEAKDIKPASYNKTYIYGDPNKSDVEKPFQPAAWDAAAMRFSYTEGAHLPTISDEVYAGLKTLIFDVSDVSAEFDLKVMNGWWSATYYDHVKWADGPNELLLTEDIYRDCAKSMGGRDLDLMLYDGSVTLNAVYYQTASIPEPAVAIPTKMHAGSAELTVTTIGERAFLGCNELTSITIPSGVTSIGSRAFFDCNGLTSVTVEAKTPIAIEENVFTNRANATLYVPAGSKAVYEVTDYWKEFKEIVEKEVIKVKLNKTNAIIEKGKSKTLKATVYPSTLEDKSVTWTSSDTKIATVSSSGKVKGVKGGMATITCTSNATGLSATCKVTVGYVKLNETEIAIEKGKSKTLKATVYPSTLEDKSVTWTSSDTKIATVSSSGKVKGVKGGMATITCTSNATGLSATCKVTVGYVKLNETEIAIEKGKSKTLKSTVYPSTLEDRSVTWTSSDTKIATVSSSGKVKGVKGGIVTITCTSNATGLSTTCKVTVGYVKLNETEITIEKGESLKLKSTVYPSTLEDRSVTWTSSNTKIATVSSSGKVKGVRSGTATITCTSNTTGLSESCTVTVLAVMESRSYEGGIDVMDKTSEGVEPFDVYDLSGRMVLHQVTSLEGLPNGIYIVNGKKILKK